MSDGLDISAKVVGDQEVKQHFLDFGSDLRARVRRVLAEAGADIASVAAASAPRLTGKLAGSIRAKLTETGFRMTESVSPTGQYGSFVGRLMEFGVVSHGTRRNVSSANIGLKAAGGKRARARRVTELRAAGTYRIEPRSFMERAANQKLAAAQAKVEKAVADVVAEANH